METKVKVEFVTVSTDDFWRTDVEVNGNSYNLAAMERHLSELYARTGETITGTALAFLLDLLEVTDP